MDQPEVAPLPGTRRSRGRAPQGQTTTEHSSARYENTEERQSPGNRPIRSTKKPTMGLSIAWVLTPCLRRIGKGRNHSPARPPAPLTRARARVYKAGQDHRWIHRKLRPSQFSACKPVCRGRLAVFSLADVPIWLLMSMPARGCRRQSQERYFDCRSQHGRLLACPCVLTAGRVSLYG